MSRKKYFLGTNDSYLFSVCTYHTYLLNCPVCILNFHHFHKEVSLLCSKPLINKNSACIKLWCTKAEFINMTLLLKHWEKFQHFHRLSDWPFNTLIRSLSPVKWRHWIQRLLRMLKCSSLLTVPLSTPFPQTIKFHRGSQT